MPVGARSSGPGAAGSGWPRRLLAIGLSGGLIGPVLWAMMIVLAGELRPGFDHVAQYISELGERGSPTAILMRYGGFVATGIMHVGYALAFYCVLRRASRRPRLTLLVALLVALNGLGRIGAGIFACEPGCAAPDSLDQRLHSLSASIAFLSVAAAALLGTLLFHGIRQLRPLSAYSFVSGCAGLIFLALMSASETTHAYTGLYERLASGVLTLWVFMSALHLRRPDLTP